MGPAASLPCHEMQPAAGPTVMVSSASAPKVCRLQTAADRMRCCIVTGMSRHPNSARKRGRAIGLAMLEWHNRCFGYCHCPRRAPHRQRRGMANGQGAGPSPHSARNPRQRAGQEPNQAGPEHGARQGCLLNAPDLLVLPKSSREPQMPLAELSHYWEYWHSPLSFFKQITKMIFQKNDLFKNLHNLINKVRIS